MVTGAFTGEEEGREMRLDGHHLSECLSVAPCFTVPSRVSPSNVHVRVDHHEVNSHLKTGRHPGRLLAKSHLLLRPLNLGHLQLGILVTHSP